jgi:tetratricopeptide (TPR) repeat protein
VSDLRGFVEEGLAAYRAKRGGPAESEAVRLSRRGDLASIKGDAAAAASDYRRAAELTPKGDPARAVRLDLLAGALSHGGPDGVRECVALGTAELAAMPDDAVGADFAATVAGCASGSKDGAGAKELLAQATARLVAMTSNLDVPFSADDRSDVQASLAQLQKDAGDEQAAEATQRAREKLLEAAAARAPDVETAATFDAHRTDCYLALHELDKAEALLSQREKQLPADYNPPARLARVLLEEKKLPLAEAAVDRALALMTQGPRRVGILGLKVKILAAQGKPTEPVLREELSVLRALPSTQKRPQAEAEIEKQLAAPAKS